MLEHGGHLSLAWLPRTIALRGCFLLNDRLHGVACGSLIIAAFCGPLNSCVVFGPAVPCSNDAPVVPAANFEV